MASIRLSTTLLRKTAPITSTPLRCYQRRWAQVHDIRFLATHPSANKIHDKYREKLERKAKEQGLKDIAQLKEAYADKIQEFRKNAIVPGANAPLSAADPPTPQQIPSSIPYQAPSPPKPQESSPGKQHASSNPKVRTLDSFINVEKVSQQQPKDIKEIWRIIHANDAQSLCAVVPSSTYQRIAKTAKQHPQFILPLPREGQGAEIHFLQWTFPSPTTATVLFTHLAEFKARGEYAQPHTTVTHHLDLAESKGLVLMEGRTMENRGIAVDESKWLLMCLQKFYGFEAHDAAAKENADRRRKLMEKFSGGDESFKIEDLLEEAERVP